MNACMEYLLEEIAIIQPRVIIALGKTAAEGLLLRDVAVTRLRGQWQEFQGIPLMVTFHPLLSSLPREGRRCRRQRRKAQALGGHAHGHGAPANASL